MRQFLEEISRHILFISFLLLATALLACGPAAESASEGQLSSQPVQQEEDGPKYPKLDATFQQLVQRFEDGELSEAQAAALAPDHFESLVMVTVDVSSNIEAIDDWLSEQGVKNPTRFANPDHDPMYINTWVPVSLLGALSQRDGVIVVSSTYDYFLYEKSASGDGIVEGRLPAPPPKPTPKYPSINDPQLQTRIDEVKAAKDHAGDPQEEVEDSVVDVEIRVTSNTSEIAEWLRDNGVDPVYAREYEDGSGGWIEALVPLSLLGVLVETEEVRLIKRVIRKPVQVHKE